MKQVNFDGLGLIEFPDDWSEDRIRTHLTDNKDAIRTELKSRRMSMIEQEAIDEAPEASFMEKVGSGAGAALQGAARTLSGTPKALAEFGEFMNRNVADLSFGQERDAKNRPLYKLGKGIEDVAEKAAPVDPTLQDSFWATDVPGALGNMGAMLATGGIAGLAGRAPAMVASIGMGMAGEFEDTFEREMGRQQSAEENPNPDKAFAKSLGYSTIAGAIESRFGAGRLIRKYQKLFGSKTAEEVAKELAEKGVSPGYIKEFLGGVAKDAAAGTGEEMAQRAVQDLIVEGKLSPNAIFREGGAGGIAQALLGLPGSHFNAKRNGRTAPITQQVIEESESLQPLTADTVAAMEKEFVIDPKTPFVDLQPGVTKQNETQSNPAPAIPTPVSEVVPPVPAIQTTDGALPVEPAHGNAAAITPAATETTAPVPQAAAVPIVEPRAAEVPTQPVAAAEPQPTVAESATVPLVEPNGRSAPVWGNEVKYAKDPKDLTIQDGQNPTKEVVGTLWNLMNGTDQDLSQKSEVILLSDPTIGSMHTSLEPIFQQIKDYPSTWKKLIEAISKKNQTAAEPEQGFKPGDRVTWATSKGKQLSGTVAEIGKDTVRIDTDGGKGKSVVSVKKLNAIPEIPKLRSMENQGDLLSTQTEDLALTGERGVDFERIQRENTEADQEAREAAEIHARQQLGFDIPSSEEQGPTQRGTITVPPSADVQKGTAMTAEPVGESLPGPSAKKRPRIDRTSGDRPPDILDFVEQIGKIKLKSAARAGALEYYNDSHKQLMKTSFRKLFSHTGQAPDVIVEDLRRNREVPDDFTTGDLWDSMLSAIQARKNYRQQYTQRNKEGDQFDQFSKIALENKRPKKSDRESAVEIPVESLNRGDQFKLQGVNVEVRRVDPETGARSMKDGDRFGYQDVPAKETIHADAGTLKKNLTYPPSENQSLTLEERFDEKNKKVQGATDGSSSAISQPAETKVEDSIEGYAPAGGTDRQIQLWNRHAKLSNEVNDYVATLPHRQDGSLNWRALSNEQIDKLFRSEHARLDAIHDYFEDVDKTGSTYSSPRSFQLKIEKADRQRIANTLRWLLSEAKQNDPGIIVAKEELKTRWEEFSWFFKSNPSLATSQGLDEKLASLKIDTKGKVYDAIAGIPIAIWNGSIDAIRLAIRAGKTLAEAIRDGIAYVKSQGIKADDQKYTAAVNELFDERTFWTNINATQAHSKRKQTTAFAIPENEINYFTQTEKGRTELANRWIESHGGDLEAARLGVLRSDAKMLGINDSLKIVFLTQIEIKAIEKWTTEKNPVDKMRWLELARLTDQDAQKAVSDAGQGLQASQQRYREAVASGPMMDYINGILQGQQLALGNRFPEVVSDNIRKWLSESADIAIAKIKKEVSEAANVADRKLKQGVEELETTFRDIMTASVKTQRNVQQEIYRRIRTHKNLKDLTSAEALELTNLLAGAWHKARMKVFRTEFRKAVPLPNVAESDKAKLEASIPEIIKQANLGLFDNEAFRNAVAPRYGAKGISEETAKKIFEASQKAQDKPEGAQRNEALREVFNIVKREAGLSHTSLLSGWWYASILSGAGTQVRNIVGTASNLASHFAALSVREPKAIPAMIMGLLRGFRMNAQGEFQAIIKRGAPSSRVATEIKDAANALELAKDDPRAWARLLSNGRFVSRFMIATDSFFYDGAVEMRGVFDAFRDGKEQGLTRSQLQNYIFDTLKVTESERTTAIAQAKSEIAGGLTNPKDLQRRTNEILRQRRPDEIRARGGQMALEATLNNEPQGLLGFIANKAIETRSKFPGLTPIIPFIRITANVGNMLLNHSPAGLARLIYARPGAKLAFGGKHDYRLTVDQWQQLRAQVILSHSMAIGLTILAAAEADEDEPLLELHGNFRNIPAAKRRQLEESGLRPYSIKIAGQSFEYKVTPMAMMLAAIGGYLDGVKYGELEEKELTTHAVTMAAGAWFVVQDQNFLSAIGQFLGSSSQITKDANTHQLVRFLARTTGGVVPTLFKDMDTWINPEVQKSVEAWDYFQQEVPVLRWAIDRPLLNALGEPIERARYPWTALFSSEKDDPIWQALSDKARAGVFLPVASASAKVLHNGVREKMTDEEFWRYQKAVGTAYKKYFQTGNNLQNFQAMTPAQAELLFDKTFDKIRSAEREKIR